MLNRIYRKVDAAPARCPFFYGWVILACGTLGMLMSIPGQTMGVSVFTDPLLGALGLSRVQLSLAYLIGTVGSALLLTHAGKLYDRLGARAVGPAAAIGLGLVLLALTRVDTFAAGLARWTGLRRAFSAFAAIMAGFFLLRLLGQGVLTMVSRSMAMKWFDRRRGLANAILGLFVSFGFSYAPQAFSLMIGAYGWRGAWMRMGLLVGGVFSVLAWLFFRDTPESLGLEPDGKLPAPDSPDAPVPVRHDLSLHEAWRTYRFWVFNVALAMIALWTTGLTFHLTSIFDQAGMSPTQAVAIFLPASIICVGLQFVAGWASDHTQLKYILIVCCVGLAVSMASVVLLGMPWTVNGLIVGMGVTNGMFGILVAVAWPRFFGRKHLGEIAGFAMTFMVIGSAIGPFAFSLSLRYAGSYAPAAAVCLAITLVLLAGGFWAHDPAPTRPSSDPFRRMRAATRRPRRVVWLLSPGRRRRWRQARRHRAMLLQRASRQ